MADTRGGRKGGPRSEGSKGRKRQGSGAYAARRRAAKQAGTEPHAADPGESKAMRLNRYIARSGVCSRREADTWITSGRVTVNDEVVTELGTRVEEGDRVVVNGRRITPRSSEYYLLNKPKDTITTKDDEKGRKTVLDLIELPEERKAALFPVGRLDRDTTGVLLVVSDGDLAHRLMHPSYEIEKWYRVRTDREVTEEELVRLVEGVPLDDGEARADRAAYVALPDRREIGVSLHEGRNRQVRRMLEALGHRVAELERVRYAGLTTQGLRRGAWRRLTEREVARLYKLVKLR